MFINYKGGFCSPSVHHSHTVQAKQIRIAYVHLTSVGRFTYINTLQWLHDFALRTISEPKDGLCRAQTLSLGNRMTKLFWSSNNHFVEKDRLKSIDSFLSSQKLRDSKFRQIVTSTNIKITFTHHILWVLLMFQFDIFKVWIRIRNKFISLTKFTYNMTVRMLVDSDPFYSPISRTSKMLAMCYKI